MCSQLLTPSTILAPTEQTEPTIYSSLIVQSEFHVVANSISNRLLSRPPVSASEALQLNTPLRSWEASLPNYFQFTAQLVSTDEWYIFAKAKLSWRLWNLRILLTRPILLQRTAQLHSLPGTPSYEDTNDAAICRKLCIDSAHLTICSIEDYVLHNTLTRLSSWYALYVSLRALPFPYMVYDPDINPAISCFMPH